MWASNGRARCLGPFASTFVQGRVLKASASEGAAAFRTAAQRRLRVDWIPRRSTRTTSMRRLRTSPESSRRLSCAFRTCSQMLPRCPVTTPRIEARRHHWSTSSCAQTCADALGLEVAGVVWSPWSTCGGSAPRVLSRRLIVGIACGPLLEKRARSRQHGVPCGGSEFGTALCSCLRF